MTVTDLLAAIAPVGRDPATGGYRRFSWTETDATLTAWFAKEAKARDLSVETDRNGNLWACWGDPAAGDIVATGSHLDSVPNGGAFDGALGVASAFAAIDLMKQRGSHPSRPIAVVAFTEEEGARFGVPCLGSRLLTGSIEPELALGLADPDAITLADAMAAAGLRPEGIGAEPERLARLSCFVELHIEQGRGLVDLASSIAIGSEIWPHGRWRLDFTGIANHAGTTAMADRTDPMPSLARTVLSVEKKAASLDARATFGRLRVEPNGTNAIASHLTAWLDARAPTREQLALILAAIPPTFGLTVTAESVTPGCTFDPALRARIADLVGNPPQVATGAGHDSGILAGAGLPTAMLFVRNPTGVSHSPEEYASPEDCQSGAEALASVLIDLSNAK